LQLASVLKAVISQRLARKADGSGFVPAVEVMINNPRVREMIEDPDRTREIIRAIEEGQVAWGMQSFDQSLMELIGKRMIDEQEALSLSTSPEDLRVRLNGITAMDGKKWGLEPKESEEDLDRTMVTTEVELEKTTILKRKA
jgi:twitching motility protein PilT